MSNTPEVDSADKAKTAELSAEIIQASKDIVALVSPENQKEVRHLLFQFYMRSVTLGVLNILAAIPVATSIKNISTTEEDIQK